MVKPWAWRMGVSCLRETIFLQINLVVRSLYSSHLIPAWIVGSRYWNRVIAFILCILPINVRILKHFVNTWVILWKAPLCNFLTHLYTLLGLFCKGSRGCRHGSKSRFGCFEHCCCWKVAWCCSQGKCSSRSSKGVMVDPWNARSLLQSGLCEAPSFGCWGYDWFACNSRILEEQDPRALKVHF